jgi:hypothetical protein
MTPRLHQLISTSRLTLGGSTTISPRVTTATQQSWHHLSNARGLGYFFINNFAASTFAIWWFLLWLDFLSTLEDFIMHRLRRVQKAKCSFILHKVDYRLLSSHPTVGGCAAYIHFTYHRIWASDTACEKESQGKDRKSLFICAGESKIQSI